MKNEILSVREFKEKALKKFKGHITDYIKLEELVSEDLSELWSVILDSAGLDYTGEYGNYWFIVKNDFSEEPFDDSVISKVLKLLKLLIDCEDIVEQVLTENEWYLWEVIGLIQEALSKEIGVTVAYNGVGTRGRWLVPCEDVKEKVDEYTGSKYLERKLERADDFWKHIYEEYKDDIRSDEEYTVEEWISSEIRDVLVRYADIVVDEKLIEVLYGPTIKAMKRISDKIKKECESIDSKFWAEQWVNVLGDEIRQRCEKNS